MFKTLLISLVLFTGVAFGQSAVQTPTLQGTYTWTGHDTFTFGNLGFTALPPQCANGTVMNGFQADLTPNCVSGVSYNPGVENQVGAEGLSSSATKLTFANSTAGYPSRSCGIIDTEFICYTSLDVDGFSVDGLTRGEWASTPAGHGANANWLAVVAAFAPLTNTPRVIVFDNGSTALMAINNQHPDAFNPGAVLEINTGQSEMYVGTDGTIHQFALTSTNALAESSIGVTDTAPHDQDYITNAHNVMQITNQYQTQQSIGFGGGIAGGVSFQHPATIAAPQFLDGNPSGSTAYSYLCQDHAGLVPGTVGTRMDAVSLPFVITIVCPRQSGVATYDILRTAGGINQGAIALNVLPGSGINDVPSGSSASPLAVIGSNTSTTYIDGLDSLSSGDLADLNLSISTAPLCIGANHKLTATGCVVGSSTILSCSSGIACSLVGSTWELTATGSAGTGDIASGITGAMTGYSATGTTVTQAPNMYVLNPGWSLAQMSGLFSRFSGVSATSYSITSNVVTMQGVNYFNIGDTPDLVSFPTSTFFNNQVVTILSSGLSNTQFEFAFTHADTSGSVTETGYASLNTPQQPVTSAGLVIIPPNMPDNPATAFTNGGLVGPSGQVADTRKGYWIQQASGYGVKCDATQLNVTVTSGSNAVNVGSSLDATAIGKTFVIGQQVGYGNTGTQNVWVAQITGYSFPNITLSANAPFGFAGVATIGTNNQKAFQRALNDVGSIVPLWIPQCSMLTDTVRWNGANLLGQQMNATNIYGIPGHDIFQQQDGVPVTAWSINATTGVTTFTIPSYSAHNVLVGDSINLQGFPTSTFFNNQNETIASQPTPITFTVNSAFSQSTSSGTEAGVAAPNTSVNANAIRVENLQFRIDNSIDPSFKWNQYDANATLTVEPPYYRPLQEFGQPMNNPFAPGWGQGTINGVATISQNLAVICVPTALAHLPATGALIVFPYQAGGLFSATVISTAGSCSTGFSARTLSATLPNTSGYTAAQAEWFTYTTPQTLGVAIPGTITLPYTITVALPFPPVPGFESNVSSHGRLIIGNQQWDYMGTTFGGTAGGTATLVLRNGPTSVNSGSGYAIGSVIFPLNPCQAMYNNPWPVVPSINTNAATPVNATYYAGLCGGNAAMALPMSDAYAYAPFSSSGFSIGHFIDVSGTNTVVNPLGNSDNNGSMLLYEQGNYTGYGSTYDDIRASGLWGGIMQGPASVNQWGINFHSILPTSTGQSFKNCTFRTGYALTFYSLSQSNVDRCDTYSTETSPYDGTNVGSSTGLYISHSVSETDGTPVTGTSQLTIKDYNNEPENGNHFETPVAVESDATIVDWIGTVFEGGYNIFGGSYQIFHGSFLGNPVFNYGNNNYFEHMSGLNTGYSTNVYNGSEQFFNWGQFSQAECTNGGANTLCGPGFAQMYNGHDAFATLMGDPTHPNENLLGGMILPGEFNQAGAALVYDPTELYWGSHTECAVTTGGQCVYGSFDGFNGAIYIGPHQRLTDTKNVLKMNFKAKSGSVSFTVLVQATDPGTGCTPNFSLASTTVTANSTGWTPAQMPVDFTGTQGCTLGLAIQSPSVNDTIEIGYFNFVPFPGQLYIPLGTHTINDACPVAGEISLDHLHLWTCRPTSGVQFGPGTWQPN